MQVYREHSLRFGAVSASEQEASPWYDTLPDREMDCVKFRLAVSPVVRGTDIGQSIWRLRDHREESPGVFAVPCVMPKMKQWDYVKNRMYIGTELLLIQGFSVAKMQQLLGATPQRLQADLAGNVFAPTVVMSVLSGVVFGTLWGSDDDGNQVETTTTETADAMSVLKRARRRTR